VQQQHTGKVGKFNFPMFTLFSCLRMLSTKNTKIGSVFTKLFKI